MKIFFIIIYIFLSQYLYSQIKVDADFENGNVEIIQIDDYDNIITIYPSLETKENTTRCWFYFKVFDFDKTKNLIINIKYVSIVIAPNYPVFSYDKINWTKLKTKEVNGFKQISSIFTQDTVYFATGFPYTYTQLNNYISTIKEKKNIEISTLTKSEKNNDVPKLTITKKSVKSEKQIIWIIARQHAFETNSNYFIEGMIDYFLTINKDNKKLNRICEINIIPMVDVDNVIIGASGRMQNPVDFNRDWNLASHWNVINELKKQIYESVQNNTYSMFWDIHSTYPGGGTQLYSYFDIYVKSPESDNMKKLWDIYEKISNIRPIKLSDKIEDKGYKWADQYNGNRDCEVITENCFKTEDFSLTLECEWNLRPDGEQWTIENIKQEGFNVGKSICKYILEKQNLIESNK